MQEFYQLTQEQQGAHLRDLACAAIRSWGLGQDATVEMIKHRENAVFSVRDPQTNRRYALRVHRYGYHSDASLRSELQWMGALNQAGVRTPGVIPALYGELFVNVSVAAVPKPHQCDLLEWLDGQPLGSIEGDVVDPKHLVENYRKVGELMARMHNQSQNWQLPPGFYRMAWDEEGTLGENAQWGRFWDLQALSHEQRILLCEAADKVRSQLQAFGKDADRYGLIHNDFLPENLLQCDDGIRIIDFDDAGFGWHLFEFATALFFHLGEDHFDAVFDALVAGYRSVRPLPDNQLEMMPTFFMQRGLVYIAWLHSRRETDTAQALTAELVEGVSALAADYLGNNS